ncbi:hypothetical protein [Pseudomonas fluorescens]|uniref:Lipoprotein n=1 Tax=Pseudomonas fluorescens TaxID=294 RepID=A0A5E7EN20_PSEFL|nr:hypothetical protein [Pseudomonas fluorescens]VVO28188.1 hypothetical protein PS723_04770 [Pseudomonas fluorescens]
MFEAALRQLMIGILLAIIFLISGCLTSDKPLIGTSDFPIPAGTKILQYSDKTGTYEKPSEYSLKTLSIRDGWYVYSEPDASDIFFKLHKVTATTWVMMTHIGIETGQYAYGWMKHEGELYVIYPGEAKQLRNWKGQAELNADWKVLNNNVQILTLDYLASIMPAAVAAQAHGKPIAFKVADAATLEVDRNFEISSRAVESLLKENEEKLKKIDEELKKLCGGRVCSIENNTTLYRTEKYDPPMWYYQDGRLAPESAWPK